MVIFICSPEVQYSIVESILNFELRNSGSRVLYSNHMTLRISFNSRRSTGIARAPSLTWHYTNITLNQITFLFFSIYQKLLNCGNFMCVNVRHYNYDLFLPENLEPKIIVT